MLLKELYKEWSIALTGGIASGKSTVASMLRSLGYLVIDADQLSRKIVEPGTPGLEEIVQHFGKDVLTPSGALDRARMRSIVFTSESDRLKLESIIHHRLSEASEEELRQAGLFEHPHLWFYEASLIYERGREADFAAVCTVFCEEETQIARVMQRDGISRDEAKKIIAIQMPSSEKAKRAHFVISSEGSREQLEARVKETVEAMKTFLEDKRDGSP